MPMHDLQNEIIEALLLLTKERSQSAACFSDSLYEAGETELRLLSRISNQSSLSHFKLGRLAARQALAKINLDYSSFSLGRLEDGQADWPEGVCGSISHSSGTAVAVAAKKADYDAVGIDIQFSRETNPKLLDKVASLKEQQMVQDIKDPSLLFFSCKESIYKCINSYIEKQPGFMDAGLTSIIEDADGTFRLEFSAPSPFTQIKVQARLTDSYCLSICYLPLSELPNRPYT